MWLVPLNLLLRLQSVISQRPWGLQNREPAGEVVVLHLLSLRLLLSISFHPGQWFGTKDTRNDSNWVYSVSRDRHLRKRTARKKTCTSSSCISSSSKSSKSSSSSSSSSSNNSGHSARCWKGHSHKLPSVWIQHSLLGGSKAHKRAYLLSAIFRCHAKPVDFFRQQGYSQGLDLCICCVRFTRNFSSRQQLAAQRTAYISLGAYTARAL